MTLQRAFRHPKFTPQNKYHDIALIELDEEVKLSYFIWPACLAQNDIPSGKILDIAGFGKIGDQGLCEHQNIFLNFLKKQKIF